MSCAMDTFSGQPIFSGFGVWAVRCAGEWENSGNNSLDVVDVREEGHELGFGFLEDFCVLCN
jgi:hypothetical protein